MIFAKRVAWTGNPSFTQPQRGAHLAPYRHRPDAARDVAGRLELTATGRERYRQISGAIAPGSPPEEINAALVNSFSGRR
jgi:hypothetical protein